VATFSGTLLGIGNNTGIEVPEDVVLAFDRGKRVPVSVTVNGYTYRSTIASMGGKFLIPVSSAIRAETGLKADDPIDVTLELDDAPREVEVPAELAEALAADPLVAEAWDKLSYSRKRQHTLAIDGAKAAETKGRRVAKTIATLRGEE
jgi:hypothetical protein